jgi:hypothetical protein
VLSIPATVPLFQKGASQNVVRRGAIVPIGSLLKVFSAPDVLPMASTRVSSGRFVLLIVIKCTPGDSVHLIPLETTEKVNIESAKPAVDAYNQEASLLLIILQTLGLAKSIVSHLS